MLAVLAVMLLLAGGPALSQEVLPSYYSEVRLSESRSKILIADHLGAGRPDGISVHVLMDRVIQRAYRDKLMAEYGSACEMDVVVKSIGVRPQGSDMRICSKYKLKLFDCIDVSNATLRGNKPSVEQTSERVPLVSEDVEVCGVTAVWPSFAYKAAGGTASVVISRLVPPERMRRIERVSRDASGQFSGTLKAFDKTLVDSLSRLGISPQGVTRQFSEDRGGKNYYTVNLVGTSTTDIIKVLGAMNLRVSKCSASVCSERFSRAP